MLDMGGCNMGRVGFLAAAVRAERGVGWMPMLLGRLTGGRKGMPSAPGGQGRPPPFRAPKGLFSFNGGL